MIQPHVRVPFASVSTCREAAPQKNIHDFFTDSLRSCMSTQGKLIAVPAAFWIPSTCCLDTSTTLNVLGTVGFQPAISYLRWDRCPRLLLNSTWHNGSDGIPQRHPALLLSLWRCQTTTQQLTSALRVQATVSHFYWFLPCDKRSKFSPPSHCCLDGIRLTGQLAKLPVNRIIDIWIYHKSPGRWPCWQTLTLLKS